MSQNTTGHWVESVGTRSGMRKARGIAGNVWMLGLCLGVVGLSLSGLAFGQDVVYFEETFESTGVSDRWSLAGDWRFKTNSACLPNDVGYISATHSLVFDFGSDCAYRNNRSGFATMTMDVSIPANTPSAQLEWWDFVGAEAGADFYFVQISTDGGVTWPHEVYRDSADETFWDQESVDLGSFIGESIRVRFGFTSDESITNLGWYIDDVRIVGESLGEGISAVSVAEAVVSEGANGGTPTLDFQLTVEPPNAESIVVEHITESGTATAGLDFVSSSGTFTIPAGSSTSTLTVDVIDDVLFERTEELTLVLEGSSSNAVVTIASATGTIIDDEELVNLYTEDFEPRAGTFRWTIPHPNDPFGEAEPEAELWHVQDSSACLTDVDPFVSPTHALIFNDESTCTYDTAEGIEGWVEMTENVRIVDVDTNDANDVLAAQLSFHHYLDVMYDAQRENKTQAFVELSDDGGQTWTTLDTFEPAEPSSESFVIPWREEIIDLDAYIGKDVRLRFRFKQPVEPNRHTATGWFIDDVEIGYAKRPSGISKVSLVSSPEPSANEGNFGTHALDFDLTIFPASAEEKVISFETFEINELDAAVAEDDYVTTSGQLVIPPGASTASIRVLLIGDDITEPDERFGLRVSNVTPNVFLVNNEVRGVILNDDAPSTFDVQVKGGGGTVVNEGDGTVTFEVAITPPRTTPISVNYETVDGTAVAGPGLDYVGKTGALTFPENTTTADITVAILDDGSYEDPDGVAPRDNEDFQISVISDTPLATSGATTIEIEDNDPLPPMGEELPALNVMHDTAPANESLMVQEGSCATVSATDPCGSFRSAVFVVTLSKAIGAFDTTVDYATVDGTATGGMDYETMEGTLTIEAGETEGIIEIPILADRAIEEDEWFEIILSNPVVVDDADGEINIETNRQRATIVNDDYKLTVFSADGAFFNRFDLITEMDENTALLGPAVTFQAAEFRGFEYDTLYGWDNGILKSINLATGEVLEVADNSGSTAGDWTGLAWDHTNGNGYAVSSDGDVAEVDFETGALTVVASSPGLNLVAVSVHPTSGRIYAIEAGSGVTNLIEIIPGDWSFNTVRAITGVIPGTSTDSTLWDSDFDDMTGELYLNAFTSGGGDAAAAVDLATDAANSALTARNFADQAAAFATNASNNFPLFQFLIDGIDTAETTLSAANATFDAANAAEGAANLSEPNAPTEAAEASAAADDAFAAASEASAAAFAAYDAIINAYYIGFIGLPFTSAEIAAANAAALAAIDNAATKADDAAVSADTAAIEADEAAIAAAAGEAWVQRIVNVATGGSQVAAANPDFKPIALATPPPPGNVLWTSDYAFPNATPNGVELQADEDTLANSEAAAVVTGVGDVNGDSFEDFLVTAKDATVSTDGGDLANAGRAFLFYGNVENTVTEFVTSFTNGSVTFGEVFLDGGNGLVINGSEPDQRLGVSATGLGDIDGDGLADFAVGFEGSSDAGGVYLIFGSDSFPDNVSASDIGSESLGAAIDGVRVFSSDANDLAGFHVAGAGDFNGDGLGDMILGAPDAGTGSAQGPGAAYIVFGSGSGIGSNGAIGLQNLSTPRGIRILGEANSDRFGVSVSGVGDVNGDGVDDVIIGGPNADSGLGRAYVIFGHVDYAESDGPGVLDLSRLNGSDPTLEFTTVMPESGQLGDTVNPPITFPDDLGTIIGKLPGLIVQGEQANSTFAQSVTGPGDLDGDGVADFVIGESGYDGSGAAEPFWGRVHVVLGNEAFTPEITIPTIGDTLPGIVLSGVDNGDMAGAHVTGAGDINGDGLMDVLISAEKGTPGGFSGEAYVLLGRKTYPGSLSLRDLANNPGMGSTGLYVYNTIEGAGLDFGKALSTVGDANGDSINDYIVAQTDGALVLYGATEQVSSRYMNRMAAATDPITGVPGGGGADLAQEIFKGVGLTGDRRMSKPASRAEILFKGGGAGPKRTEPSTQTVTVFREASPDLAVGEGTMADDDRWIPGDVYWRVETDRQQFTYSEINLHYTPDEVEGFDLQKVAVFYAKPNQTLTENTVWSWLPFTHDPERRVFTVARNHDEETAQQEFNGYYALVQADLLTFLGGVIPAVGVTNENVYQFGPEVTPSDKAFWHTRDKKLYAICEGELTIKWKNANGDIVSEVRAVNLWPEDDSGVYQDFVATSPGVELIEPGGPFEFKSSQLTCADDNVVLPGGGLSDNVFAAQLSETSGSDDTGRAMVMLSTSDSLDQGDLFFQFVRVINWDNSTRIKPSLAGQNWDVGDIISAGTDAIYATFHTNPDIGPYVLFENAPYAPRSERYDGFYDRATQTGSIVPVNKVIGDTDPMVVVYYEEGGRLIEANTGNPARHPDTRERLTFFDWPYTPANYNLDWPDNADKIIIARQDGSGERDVATYGDELDVYVQNDPNEPGYNPNEEHALIAPFGAGNAVFALRDDLNGYENASEPFALMTYKDPNDLTDDGEGVAKMEVHQVVATEGAYQFAPSPMLPKIEDPYEGDVGAFIQPPYPLSIFAYSPRNTSSSISAPGDQTGKVFEDRTARHWAMSDGSFAMKFFYPPQADFYFPSAYQEKLNEAARQDQTVSFTENSVVVTETRGPLIAPTESLDFSVGGDPIPLLDGGPATTTVQPVDVTYSVDWPDNPPTMRIGEILLEAKFGLPQINGQCSVDLIYQESQENGQGPSAILIEPTVQRSVDLDTLDPGITTAFAGTKIIFPDLPPALQFRITYDQSRGRLNLDGIVVDPVLGFDYVLLNVINEDEADLLRDLSDDPAWQTAVDELASIANEPVFIAPDGSFPASQPTIPPELASTFALSTGNAKGTGFVTLAFQNADTCAPLPVSVEVIEVVPDLEPGSIAVVTPACVFEEKLTMRHTNDFGGHPEDFEFEWLYQPDEDGTIPASPDVDPQSWSPVPINGPTDQNELTIEGPGLLTLTDNWFVVRYRHKTGAAPYFNNVSDWTMPQLGEGWIKRVVGEINPFTQRASGGGIQGAEESFAQFQSSDEPNRIVSMISQAGPRFTGSLPLNCDNLDDFGLIPIYQTVMNRGMDLSIDALSPVDNPGVNTALLLVASRVADLYTLLGNEAFADAADPTIAFGTDDSIYGAEATSIHAFMNQTSSLLEEELALLRGRDNTFAPGTQLFPLYNRLVWNFSRDITGGEVAYALNYNIKDDPDSGDGTISEADAARLYPQGHGDAWGHYLMAAKTYYTLLSHPFYTWSNRSEAVLVGGQPLTVDFIDEQRFAKIAAGKAKSGADIIDLTYRDQYKEDPDKQWRGYKDDDRNRAWGLHDWAQRAGQGAYFDWVTGNAILRAEDPDPDATGITKIDRTTVHELREVAAAYERIQDQADSADLGLNPLGLGNNVVPFDIDPTLIDDGVTHFEQIYSRALVGLQNAEQVFDHANNSTQLLRRQADSQDDFAKAVIQREQDIKNRLIEIFGYPYPDDIGPGGTYPEGYDGPDLFHFMYTDDVGLFRDGVLNEIYFDPQRTSDSADFDGDLPGLAETVITDQNPEFGIGEGDIIFEVDVVNYLGVNRDYTFPTIPSVSTSLGDVLNIFGSSNDGYEPFDPFGGLGQPAPNVLPSQSITVKYHLSNDGGRFGLKKPDAWVGERRAPGEIQLAQSELRQALARLMIAIDDYGGFAAKVKDQVDTVEAQFGVSAHEIFLLDRRLAKKKTVQDVVLTTEATQLGLRTAANIIEQISENTKESVPTVTGVIVGFSNGVIIDGLAPVRGGLGIAGTVAAEALKLLADAADLFKLRLAQNGERADDQLNIDTTELQGKFANLQQIFELEDLLRNEIPLRIQLHTQHDAVMQAAGRYLKVLGEGQRLMEERTRFRRQTAASVQTQRYNDMAFRIFRNDALQKYRAQYDLASRYVYLAAKAYDYETTMLSNDPLSGQRFLAEIVKARQLGTLTDGLPQTGQGLANSMAVMARNFEVLSGQLGFNNPQRETNRFSLRSELFRSLPGADGDEAWRTLLSQDYLANGVGTIDNLWDLPEFRRYCVPPAGFGQVEPGIVIPFSTVVEEGKNFFGRELGGLDNSYDSTQFATKVRSVGIWFSNYDALNLSNTPRVWLVPAGIDKMRSPTGSSGAIREFNVLDQVLPVPFPLGGDELNDPDWIPSVESLSGQLTAIRRFGRLRAYHDSGQFSIDEVSRDSRLIGRSVWNTKWMLIIPASTLSQDRDEALQRLINGSLVNGERDGNGISDIKLFFETYAYSRLKNDVVVND